MPHVSTEDDVYGGYFIPKGTPVVGNIWAVNMDPRRYADPEKFDPQRWTQGRALNYKSPEHPRPLTKDESLLFSQGPRICLGKKFAQVEAVAFLVLLLREYRVEPICRPGESTDEWQKRVLRPFMVLTLHFQDKIPLRLVRRQPVA